MEMVREMAGGVDEEMCEIVTLLQHVSSAIWGDEVVAGVMDGFGYEIPF